jgi:hypothetical protein
VHQTKFYLIHRVRQYVLSLGTNAKVGALMRRLDQHQADVMLLGHFHQGSHHGLENRRLKLVINGALGGSEPFYAEEHGYWNQPAQAVIHVPQKGKPTLDDVIWVRWDS